MSIFKTNKLLYGNPVIISKISKAVSEHFASDGYEVLTLADE